MRVDAFDFDLPPERIALRPARPRDAARMLVVQGDAMSDAGGIGLLSAATETCTMRDITAGGSPLWIASTYCMPEITRPKAV